MEMPILMFEQQQAPVTTPLTSEKNVNTKQAEAGPDSFKTSFNKAMDDAADKGKTTSDKCETEMVQGEEKAPEKLPMAGMFFVVAPPVLSQPVMELSTDVVPATIELPSGVITTDITPNTGNREMIQQQMPVISQEIPVMSQPTPETSKSEIPEMSQQNTSVMPAGLCLQKPNPVDLTTASGVQSDSQEIVTSSVQNNNPPTESAPETVTAIMGQEQRTPVQNVKSVPLDMTGQPVVTVPAGLETVSKDKAADNGADIGLKTQVTVANEVAEEGIATVPRKEDPLSTEKKSIISKEVLTSIAVPAAETTEQRSLADGFNSDTAENPSLMTSTGAMLSTKAETVKIPFPAVETPLPVKEQVFQEIVQKAQLMSNGTQQEVQIQLKPEHLGLLNLQISVENGAVTAKFQTDNPLVKQALEASFNQLKQDLQTQGLKVQHVEVSIAQQGMSFSEFSRRAPQFNLIKSKRIAQGEVEAVEQSLAQTSLIENYGGLHSSGVDYRV